MRRVDYPQKKNRGSSGGARSCSRQQSARVPLAQFCRQMGISYRKFSYWRQRLREMDAASSGFKITTPSGSPKPARPVVRDTTAAFVPVSIIDRDVPQPPWRSS